MAPPVPVDPTFAGLIYVPRLNWHYALLAAASVAMVIGLGQQIHQLARLNLSDTNRGGRFHFARLFGISWRSVIGFLITVCLTLQLLISRQVIRTPEREEYLLLDVFPNCLWAICIVVVLLNCVDRWQRNATSRVEPLWQNVAVWLIGLVFGLILLPDLGLIQYLVHLATEGIESAQPLFQQRLGVFPNHRNEGYRLFWQSIGALGCVVMAALLLTSQHRRNEENLGIRTVIGQLLLLPPLAFCIWFYFVEFHRISPDLASAGFSSIWYDWLGATALAIVAISAWAHRLTKADEKIEIAETHLTDRVGVPIHESLAIQLLLIASATVFCVETIRGWLRPAMGILGVSRWLDVIGGMFYDKLTMLYVVISLLSLKLAWHSWRQHNTAFKWELARLDRQKYLWNWVTLAALVVVGIPTLSAYSFIFWLGPWSR